MLYSKRRFKMGEYYKSKTSKWKNIHDEYSNGSPPNRLLLFCDLILQHEKYKIDNDKESDIFSTNSERTNDSFSLEDDSNEYIKNEKDSDEEDSWNLVTCFCMKPYYGRAMIECTQCKTWLHMSCAKIRPNNVPDVFKCNLCRKTKGSKRRSARIRGDRSRFLA